MSEVDVGGAWHPLADGVPPAWASIWGQDRFGVFAGFEVGGVECRMRWIPPGRHALGSPEDEPGRWQDEDRVDVELPGFWLAEFPCTQALYRAVTGENPSRFVDLRRPVERVSWIDAWKMIRALNQRVPGLDARLPYEAAWEAACRAGSSDATYAGPIEILGERNAPVLDTIAWYGGNSGVGFELDNGIDSSDWPEKQFAHERAGTRAVGCKRANPLGLYDMLGNVSEWCWDRNVGDCVQSPSLDEAFADGIPDDRTLDDLKDGGIRVLRGGSWGHFARYCRAASRIGGPPGNRREGVGFRLSRGQR